MAERPGKPDSGAIGSVVFASDQGLVGQFNEVVADYAIGTLAALPGKPQVRTVGERVHAHLADAGLPMMGLFSVPNFVRAITPLVGRIQIESEAHRAKREYGRVYVFHNRPRLGSFCEPVSQRTLRALIREYVFYLALPGVRGISRQREREPPDYL
jgi:F-type H+-transporting ATPase subunit gamma